METGDGFTAICRDMVEEGDPEARTYFLLAWLFYLSLHPLPN